MNKVTQITQAQQVEDFERGHDEQSLAQEVSLALDNDGQVWSTTDWCPMHMDGRVMLVQRGATITTRAGPPMDTPLTCTLYRPDGPTWCTVVAHGPALPALTLLRPGDRWDLVGLCDALGAKREMHPDDPNQERFTFNDDSVIATHGSVWDVMWPGGWLGENPRQC